MLSRVLNEGVQTTIKAFDLIYDYVNQTEICIVGTSEYVKNSDNRRQDILNVCNRALHFIYSSPEDFHRLV